MFRKISDIIKSYEMGGEEDRILNIPENKITEKKLRTLIRDEYKRLTSTV